MVIVVVVTAAAIAIVVVLDNRDKLFFQGSRLEKGNKLTIWYLADVNDIYMILSISLHMMIKVYSP
ncbi:MAG TPA: hypothetical protein VE307_04165 [Nitrososphaeraceae archaeon]|nr:hypothetical protein [Nitrososphaeraceae archaeon]